MKDNSRWSDKKPDGKHYKNYHDIQEDVQNVVAVKSPTDLEKIKGLHKAMKVRRDRRNAFFHSTHLLDLSANQRSCVESFCDLMDYGNILFGSEWATKIKGARNLDVFEVLLRLERKSFEDPSMTPKIMKILAEWPRNISNASRKGVHLAVHPEDLHLRLCVIHGGNLLRDKLLALLT